MRVRFAEWGFATGLFFASVAAAETFAPLPISVTSVQEMSADGSVVVGTVSSDQGPGHAFRWTKEGGIQDLGTLGGTESFGTCLSADGSAIFGLARRKDELGAPFRWTAEDGMKSLGTFGSTGFVTDCSANGRIAVGECFDRSGDKRGFRSGPEGPLSDLGALDDVPADASVQVCSRDGATIFGTSVDANGVTRFFRWTPNVGMRSLGGKGGEITDCSDDGDVAVGGTFIGDSFLPVRWERGVGLRSLGTLGGSNGSADFCSADGKVVVGFATNAADRNRAFRWTEKTGMVNLGALDGRSSEATATNADCSVIGGHVEFAGGERRAFLWRKEHGMRFLDGILKNAFDRKFEGWIFEFVSEMNDDGRAFVVSALDPKGRPRIVVVELPSPSRVTNDRPLAREAQEALESALATRRLTNAFDEENAAGQMATAMTAHSLRLDEEARQVERDYWNEETADEEYLQKRIASYVAAEYALFYAQAAIEMSTSPTAEALAFASLVEASNVSTFDIAETE